MQYQMVDQQAFCRLSLLAMLYIAIGMPLVHPEFHDHSDHEHNISGLSAHHIEPTDEKLDDHCCPICEFLATSQLHQCVSAHPFEVDEPFSIKVAFIESVNIKSWLRPCEPRASPPPRLAS